MKTSRLPLLVASLAVLGTLAAIFLGNSTAPTKRFAAALGQRAASVPVNESPAGRKTGESAARRLPAIASPGAVAVQSRGPAPASLTAAYPDQDEIPASWHDYGRSAKRITVAPYPDLPLTFERTAIKDEGRYVTWFGTVKEIPGSSLVSVATPGGGWHSVLIIPGSSQFSFTTAPDGATSIAESQPGEEGCGLGALSPSRTTAEAPTTAAQFRAQYSAVLSTYTAANLNEVAEGTPKADSNALQIGVLFAYRSDLLTPLTREQVNGNDPTLYYAASVDAIDGRGKAYIESSNVVLANSGVTNFVWKYLGSFQTPTYTPPASPNNNTYLAELVSGSTLGTWCAAQAYKYGASQILFWQDAGLKGTTYGGIASGGSGSAVNGNSARAIALWATSYKTTIHELSHNFGCDHDRAHAGANSTGVADGDGRYHYGVLWSMPDTIFPGHNLEVSTIMGYGSSIIPYVSNPGISVHVTDALGGGGAGGADFGTVPIGYALTDPKAAYNAKVLTDNAAAIAALGAAITAPAITAQPQSTTVTSGSSFSVSVTATGGGLSYQWFKDGAQIAGATASSYSKASNSSDAGSYTVTVTNVAGSVTSSAATVSVSAAPPPPSGGSGGGGGGGGAPSHFFIAALALTALVRRYFHPTRYEK